jgi:N-acetylglutamate synthase-like GNAT family acetyltransferase
MSIMFSAFAVPADAPGLVAALAAEGLPTDDLGEAGRSFFRLLSGETEIGWIGCEGIGANAALLRSLAIDAAWRRRGLASAAIVWLLRHLARQGVTEAYALTTAPAVVAMLEGLGFSVLPRAAVPPGLAATRQFSGLCPASAVVLARRNDAHARAVPDRKPG